MSEIIIGESKPEVQEAEGWENEGGASGATEDIAPEAPEPELVLARPGELTIIAKFNDEQLFASSMPGGEPDRAMFIKVLVQDEDAARGIASLLLNAGAQQLQVLMQQQAAASKAIIPATQMPNRQQRRAMERLTRKA